MLINLAQEKNVLDSMIEDEVFLDTYRIFHEEKREYTWSKRNPVRKQARLHFFLTSFECFYMHMQPI